MRSSISLSWPAGVAHRFRGSTSLPPTPVG